MEVHTKGSHRDPCCSQPIDQVLDLSGGGDADGVTQTQFGAAGLPQLVTHSHDRRRGHRAFPRVAETHRHIATHRHLPRPGLLDDGSEHGHLLSQCPIQILAGESFGGAGEYRDLARTSIAGGI